MILLLAWALLAIACGFYAARLGRNDIAWALAALVLSPLIAFVFSVRARRRAGGERRMNDLPILEPLPRAGWPKHLPCPRCGRSRKTEGPGDRFHAECRLRVTELDTGPTVDLYEIRSAGRTPA